MDRCFRSSVVTLRLKSKSWKNIGKGRQLFIMNPSRKWWSMRRRQVSTTRTGLCRARELCCVYIEAWVGVNNWVMVVFVFCFHCVTRKSLYYSEQLLYRIESFWTQAKINYLLKSSPKHLSIIDRTATCKTLINHLKNYKELALKRPLFNVDVL